MNHLSPRLKWAPALPLLLGIAVLAILYVPLPAEVALHFDQHGFVDHVGRKAQLWSVPVMLVIADLVMLLRISLALATPEAARLPVTLTEANRDRVVALYIGQLTFLRVAVNLLGAAVMVLWAVSARIERPLFGLAWLVPWLAVVLLVVGGYTRAMKKSAGEPKTG